MNFFRYVLICSVALFAPLACASNTAIQKDADALCEVYNPKNWGSFFKGKQPSASDIYGEIGTRIRNAIRTKEIISIYEELHAGYKENVYGFVSKKISGFTGQPWKCVHFKNFYFPRKEMILSIEAINQVNNPLTKRPEIVVSVDAKGLVYVDSETPIKSDFDKVKSAIQSINNYKEMSIILQMDAIAPHQTFVILVAVFKSLGFSTFSIVVG